MKSIIQSIKPQYCELIASGIWQPNKQGLGMRYVFDELNRLYGDDFIRYE